MIYINTILANFTFQVIKLKVKILDKINGGKISYIVLKISLKGFALNM